MVAPSFRVREPDSFLRISALNASSSAEPISLSRFDPKYGTTWFFNMCFLLTTVLGLLLFSIGQKAFDELGQRRNFLGDHFLSEGSVLKRSPDLLFVSLCATTSVHGREISDPS